MGDLDDLAERMKFGFATESQRNEFARQTLLLAGARVNVLLKAPLEDRQDVTSDTVGRALATICSWNRFKGAWSTFVAVCARSAVRDWNIRHKRHQAVLEALRKGDND